MTIFQSLAMFTKVEPRGIWFCENPNKYVYEFLISPPENDSFRKDLCFTPDVFFSTREISEMRGPTGVKFCMMVNNRPNFIMPVQNLGGAPQKNFRGQKHSKFGPISDDFEVWRRISPKRMKIFKIR